MVKDHDFSEMQLAGIPTKFEENWAQDAMLYWFMTPGTFEMQCWQGPRAPGKDKQALPFDCKVRPSKQIEKTKSNTVESLDDN